MAGRLRGGDRAVRRRRDPARRPTPARGPRRRPFVLWASVWAQPRSAAHALALPVTRHIYRHADAVVAYGEHVRRFVAAIRGRDDDIFVAPQSVEPELFARPVAPRRSRASARARARRSGPLALYTGRLVPEKGVDVLLDAWPLLAADATLVLVGDGPIAVRAAATPGARFLGPLPRARVARGLRRRRVGRAALGARFPASASRGGWSATKPCTRAGR